MQEIYGTYNDDDHIRVCFTDEAFTLLGVPDEGTIFKENKSTFAYSQDGIYDYYHSLVSDYDMSIKRAVELFINEVKADIIKLHKECKEVGKNEL